MAWDHSKSSTERGYGWQWQKLRQHIMTRDRKLCQVCLAKGRATTAREVDHITPKEKGGTDDWDNLQAICTDCHKAKTAADNGRPLRRRIGLDGWPVG